jgi:hypothetical protein
MKLINAIAKLEKLTGQEVTIENGLYSFDFGKRVLEFRSNGRFSLQVEVVFFTVRRKNDISDAMTDYSAGSFYQTLKGAIESATN